MKVTLFFRWYDLWIGAYIDRPRRTVYICLLPTIGVKISFPRITLQAPPYATCSVCDFPLDVPCAHWLGEWEGWCVSWNCQSECSDGIEMEWPFPNKLLVTVADFEQAGFTIS